MRPRYLQPSRTLFVPCLMMGLWALAPAAPGLWAQEGTKTAPSATSLPAAGRVPGVRIATEGPPIFPTSGTPYLSSARSLSR